MSLAFGDIHPRPTIGVQLDAAGGRLRITKVVEDSGADKAGVRPDDVIIGIDGQGSPSFEDVRKILAARKIGDEITLKVIRGGQEQEMKITLR
jgi:S1-C subfamily serine protease